MSNELPKQRGPAAVFLRASSIRPSSFVLLSSFVIRASSLRRGAWYPAGGGDRLQPGEHETEGRNCHTVRQPVDRPENVECNPTEST